MKKLRVYLRLSIKAAVCKAKRFHKRRSPPIELANTTKSIKGSTKRGIIVQALTASPSTWWAFNLFLQGDLRCGSKPARRQCKVFFAKERMNHEISNKPAH